MNDAQEKLIEEAAVAVIPALVAKLKELFAANQIDLVDLKADVDRPLSDYEKGVVP